MPEVARQSQAGNEPAPANVSKLLNLPTHSFDKPSVKILIRNPSYRHLLRRSVCSWTIPGEQQQECLLQHAFIRSSFRGSTRFKCRELQLQLYPANDRSNMAFQQLIGHQYLHLVIFGDAPSKRREA